MGGDRFDAKLLWAYVLCVGGDRATNSLFQCLTEQFKVDLDTVI